MAYWDRIGKPLALHLTALSSCLDQSFNLLLVQGYKFLPFLSFFSVDFIWVCFVLRIFVGFSTVIFITSTTIWINGHGLTFLELVVLQLFSFLLSITTGFGRFWGLE